MLLVSFSLLINCGARDILVFSFLEEGSILEDAFMRKEIRRL